MKPSTIVTFGEIMGRINPPGHLRFAQAMPGTLELTFAGAEANVAASIAMLGGSARFVTALPRNVLGDACVRTLRGLGVDTGHVLRTASGRLGLYFVEKGANQRPSNVVYDRDHSSIAGTAPDAYDWEAAFADASWLHTTGITAALSRHAFDSVLAAVRAAKSAGLTVSCDLNFRKKLWRWEEGTAPTVLAGRCMREVLPFVDVVIANEEDAADVLGIEAEGSDIHGGHLAVDRYPDVAREIIRQFPNVSRVAITLRESLSASHNNWGAMLYDAATGTAHFAPLSDGNYAPYEIRNIVDRVGGGDSFGAGLVFALTTPELSAPDKAIRFAVAASCLAHSIEGDFNFSSRAEVEALMGGSASGRVVR
jgi:2-dehydro-3-deoxygluconokinase